MTLRPAREHLVTTGVRSCLRDQRAVTVVEFAFVAPVLLLLLLGGFDTAHTLYIRGVLQGAVQKSARDSALESGLSSANQPAIDDRVRASVLALANNADIKITRRFYRTFAQAAAAKAEPFPGGNDTNHNGKCDNNEIFEDLNRNGIRDLDGGDGGQGAAVDRTVYTVTATYPRMFPVMKMIGGSGTTVVTATTVLENQPYANQATYTGSTVGHCNP